jgi:hypothetical protein
MMNFAEKVIAFNRSLDFPWPLPDGIRIMNPFAENPHALETSSRFYRKYYGDTHPRKLILGINPGRFGAGVTGIPFTDTKRLEEFCGLSIEGLTTYEPSSVFVYRMIGAYGGVEAFYRDFYITSVSPLGFVKVNEKGREVNYNYYDSPELTAAAWPFMVKSIETQLEFGIDRTRCFCLGNNQNFKFLTRLNRDKGYFGEIVPLEHPRFVMQYRSRFIEDYILKFTAALKQ